MPIHYPGYKKNKKIPGSSGGRSAVAVLSLTAMVDMFTVLVIFLLQNYSSTGEFIEIDKTVELPKAISIKQLRPSNVVVISKEKLMLNSEWVSSYRDIRKRENYLIPELKKKLQILILLGEAEKASLKNKLRRAVKEAHEIISDKSETESHRKLTIQADQYIDFLTIKKVMQTATEAGIYEINFAVLKKIEGDS